MSTNTTEILNGEYAPLTWTIGFIEASASEVANTRLTQKLGMANKQREVWKGVTGTTSKVYSRSAFIRSRQPRSRSAPLDETYKVGYQMMKVNNSLSQLLMSLEPLSRNGGERELVIATNSRWSAFLDNGVILQERIGTAIGICNELHCGAVIVTCIPDSKVADGSIQFQVLDSDSCGRVQFRRTVYVTNESGRWVFGAYGEPLPFEIENTYSDRKIRNRFTSDMLDKYCEAMGIRLFDPEFYGPEGYIIYRSGRICGMTLEEGRRLIGLQKSD